MRLRKLLLPLILAFGLLAAPLPAVTVDAAAPPALELVMPLAAATTVDAPAMAEAPELPPISTNPADWFNNPLVYAAVIAAVVEFVKRHLLKDLSGLRTVLVSIALGALGSILATFDLPGIGRWNDRSLFDALVYGVQAAVIASGGWDLIRGLLGLGKARAPAGA